MKGKDISIVTNSIPVGMELTDFSGVVSFISGELLKENMAKGVVSTSITLPICSLSQCF
ncbi:hypothetical protein [Anaerobacillus alkalidiazotrophicus]|uniref:hypothetical protein n=1 Tax=Anaerobacillus alkalidiazotrophicus TaxID=472963 RepID=UPI0014724B76|nr:hypothetical protein [Anaerobacillus alkalidiazotrophicus]